MGNSNVDLSVNGIISHLIFTCQMCRQAKLTCSDPTSPSILRNHTCQGYPGYFQEPHWKSMGLPEISRVTLDSSEEPTQQTVGKGHHQTLFFSDADNIPISTKAPWSMILQEISKDLCINIQWSIKIKWPIPALQHIQCDNDKGMRSIRPWTHTGTACMHRCNRYKLFLMIWVLKTDHAIRQFTYKCKVGYTWHIKGARVFV